MTKHSKCMKASIKGHRPYASFVPCLYSKCYVFIQFVSHLMILYTKAINFEHLIDSNRLICNLSIIGIFIPFYVKCYKTSEVFLIFVFILILSFRYTSLSLRHSGTPIQRLHNLINSFGRHNDKFQHKSPNIYQKNYM